MPRAVNGPVNKVFPTEDIFVIFFLCVCGHLKKIEMEYCP